MGRLQANYNLSKDNRISIKKQSLGGGRTIGPKLNQSINMSISTTTIAESVTTSIFGYCPNSPNTNLWPVVCNPSANVGQALTFQATASSGLRSNFSISGAAATVYLQNVSLIIIIFDAAGTVTITATQPGNAFYNSASRSITVNVSSASSGGSGSSGGGVGGGGV